MKKLYLLGIDIGGTDIKAGLFSKNGDIVKWAKIPSEVDKGKKVILKNIEQLIKKLKPEKEGILPVIGVAIAGILDKKREMLIHSPNLKSLDNFAIKAALENQLNKKVILENDANAAALGELWKGSGRNIKNFLLLTLGTGLGSGLIIDGKLWLGEDGTAAELGHTKIVPDGLQCGCGGKGCLEMYFSTRAIERIVKRVLTEEQNTLLSNMKLSEAVSPKTVYTLAKKGDEVSLNIYREISHFLGIAIANVINLLGIRTFILSGGISNASDIFIPFLTEEVRKNLFYPYSKDFTIIKGVLGNTAGTTGAAYLALQHPKN
ncbi:MAG: hypothetical protein B5M53_03150 [Candidatus Cloacimonas sp. 4484_209]|nr:MAG: hypothetical protein B5M53_03150 [Candidatus Cloacimonas sp. 4484_209]